MKTLSFFFGLALVSHLGIAGTLPVIVTQPKNLTNSGTFSVAATNATDYQWRYNGMDIPGATNSSLSRSASDPAGYYMVVIKNTTGWVPSRLAYLSRDSGGYVPFSNYGNPHWQAQACYQISTLGGESQGQPVTNGTAQVVAGPEVDQMRPVGDIWGFEPWGPDWDGYFDMPPQLVPSVSPGQTVYYAVNLTYPTLPGSYTQPSRTLKLVAGGGTYPTPSADDIRRRRSCAPLERIGHPALTPAEARRSPVRDVKLSRRRRVHASRPRLLMRYFCVPSSTSSRFWLWMVEASVSTPVVRCGFNSATTRQG